MSATYKCDGCGKEAPAVFVPGALNYSKPHDWYQRSDKDGIQDACSRDCIEKVAKKSGKRGLVLPL